MEGHGGIALAVRPNRQALQGEAAPVEAAIDQKTDDETTEALTLPTVAVSASETEEPVSL